MGVNKSCWMEGGISLLFFALICFVVSPSACYTFTGMVHYYLRGCLRVAKRLPTFQAWLAVILFLELVGHILETARVI